MTPPVSWTRYCKSYNVGHRILKDYFQEETVIEEKVDGSQFSFCVTNDGELLVRSRGREFSPHAPDQLFEKAVAAVKANQFRLRVGYTYRGEYLARPKHNVLSYSRVPNSHIIIYDIATGDCDYLPYYLMKELAEEAGFEVVPQLGIMKAGAFNWELVEELLETESVLGKEKIEGLVFKRRHKVLFNDRDNMIIAKYVSPDFKERHGQTPGEAKNKKDIITRLVDEFRTETRWQKAYQHLKEQDVLIGEPKDIGPLLKEVQRDILEDAEDEIKERIWKEVKKQFTRGITRGLPEWYKEKLAKEQA